jgi:uncharacterized protein with WD repeat
MFNSPISQKTFFKGDKVQLKWNKQGSSILVLAQTDVDRSGKSYYGEPTLYLLSTSGAFDARITLDKEGPIHDVSWSPVFESMPSLRAPEGREAIQEMRACLDRHDRFAVSR